MPVNPCSENGKPGFKWGDSGKCYLYTSGDEKSMGEAKRKATIQGIATGEYMKKNNFNEKDLESLFKSLKEWFNEEWVDISRPKSGGGFEPCGRSDADTGKYPKCVPASKAARMTPEEIASAVRRKRTAESTQNRKDKKPIYVSTEKAATVNVPTNPILYARVKAAAKAKFDVYPSAYANAWLVREYKRRGGRYSTIKKNIDINKVAEDVAEPEAALAEALIFVAEKFGSFDKPGSGIWVEYESSEENDDKAIGVICENCILYAGNGVCKILDQKVEHMAKCRFALIPDGLINPEMDDDMEEDNMEEDSIMSLISMLRDLFKEK